MCNVCVCYWRCSRLLWLCSMWCLSARVRLYMEGCFSCVVQHETVLIVHECVGFWVPKWARGTCAVVGRIRQMPVVLGSLLVLCMVFHGCYGCRWGCFDMDQVSVHCGWCADQGAMVCEWEIRDWLQLEWLLMEEGMGWLEQKTMCMSHDVTTVRVDGVPKPPPPQQKKRKKKAWAGQLKKRKSTGRIKLIVLY